jgi:two-component system, LytTR family, sensor kinase
MVRETLYWIAGWTIVAVLRAADWGLSRLYAHLPTNWGHIAGETALDWYTCALLTIPYIALARYVVRRRFSALAAGAIFVAAIIAGFFLKYAIYLPLENAIFHSNYTYVYVIANDFFAVTFGNLATLAVVVAIEHSRVAREREVRASRLEAQLSMAQLQALRSQLDPHFLFNTLNAIASLISSDPQNAERMIVMLGDLLRAALSSDDTQEVQLRTEAAFIERYGALMHLRFGNRLSVNIDVPRELLDERVPHFLLQPLVENSVRHGMAPGNAPMTITVRARGENDMLRLDVVDDGAGLELDMPPHEGIGLGNTRRRLEQLYGRLATLEIAPAAGSGTAVVVRLPRRMVHAT